MDHVHDDCETQLNEAEDRIIKLQHELDELNNRIRKMSKGDLGPESILSGYEVLVKSIMARKNELIAELDKANEENKRLRKALQRIQQAEIASMKPNSVALYQMFIRETAEQALKETSR